MLIFNMHRVFDLRGVDKPHAYLVKNKFAPSSASSLLNYRTDNIRIKALEKLCVALNCTPNDFFEWHDGGANDLPETHELNSLRRAQITKTFSEMIKNVPVDKLADVETFVQSLTKEESRPES